MNDYLKLRGAVGDPSKEEFYTRIYKAVTAGFPQLVTSYHNPDETLYFDVGYAEVLQRLYTAGGKFYEALYKLLGFDRMEIKRFRSHVSASATIIYNSVNMFYSIVDVNSTIKEEKVSLVYSRLRRDSKVNGEESLIIHFDGKVDGIQPRTLVNGRAVQTDRFGGWAIIYTGLKDVMTLPWRQTEIGRHIDTWRDSGGKPLLPLIETKLAEQGKTLTDQTILGDLPIWPIMKDWMPGSSEGMDFELVRWMLEEQGVAPQSYLESEQLSYEQIAAANDPERTAEFEKKLTDDIDLLNRGARLATAAALADYDYKNPALKIKIAAAVDPYTFGLLDKTLLALRIMAPVDVLEASHYEHIRSGFLDEKRLDDIKDTRAGPMVVRQMNWSGKTQGISTPLDPSREFLEFIQRYKLASLYLIPRYLKRHFLMTNANPVDRLLEGPGENNMPLNERPKPWKGLFRDWVSVPNPFAFDKFHFVFTLARTAPQAADAELVADMIYFAKMFGLPFFFNGVLAGSTITNHLHFQTIGTILPIENTNEFPRKVIQEFVHGKITEVLDFPSTANARPMISLESHPLRTREDILNFIGLARYVITSLKADARPFDISVLPQKDGSVRVYFPEIAKDTVMTEEPGAGGQSVQKFYFTQGGVQSTQEALATSGTFSCGGLLLSLNEKAVRELVSGNFTAVMHVAESLYPNSLYLKNLKERTGARLAAVPSFAEQHLPDLANNWTIVTSQMERGLDHRILDAMAKRYGEPLASVLAQLNLTGGLGALMPDLIEGWRRNGLQVISTDPLYEGIKGQEFVAGVNRARRFGDYVREMYQDKKRDDLNFKFFLNMGTDYKNMAPFSHKLERGLEVEVYETDARGDYLLDIFFTDDPAPGETQGKRVSIFNMVYPNDPLWQDMQVAAYSKAKQLLLKELQKRGVARRQIIFEDNETYASVPTRLFPDAMHSQRNHSVVDAAVYHPRAVSYELLEYPGYLRDKLIRGDQIYATNWAGLENERVKGVSLYEHTPVLGEDLFAGSIQEIAGYNENGMRSTNGVLIDRWQAPEIRGLLGHFKKVLNIPVNDDESLDGALFDALLKPDNAALRADFELKFEYVKSFLVLKALWWMRDRQAFPDWLADDMARYRKLSGDVTEAFALREEFAAALHGALSDASNWEAVQARFAVLKDVLMENPIVSNVRRQVEYKGPGKVEEALNGMELARWEKSLTRMLDQIQSEPDVQKKTRHGRALQKTDRPCDARRTDLWRGRQCSLRPHQRPDPALGASEEHRNDREL